MKVEQLMKSEVFTCSPEDTLDRAAGIMWDHDCGCVPVLGRDGRVAGILTDRDICMAAYTQGKSLWAIPVAIAMRKKVISCRPEESLSAAEKILQANQIRRLPVIDAEGRLVGILSLNDLAREAARERLQKRKAVSDAEIGETLAAICESRSQPEVASVA
jgi:CBS domain-containing protein